MYRYTQNQAVIRLLLKLKTSDEDYPFPLMKQRRGVFVTLLNKYMFLRSEAVYDRRVSQVTPQGSQTLRERSGA